MTIPTTAGCASFQTCLKEMVAFCCEYSAEADTKSRIPSASRRGRLVIVPLPRSERALHGYADDKLRSPARRLHRWAAEARQVSKDAPPCAEPVASPLCRSPRLQT